MKRFLCLMMCLLMAAGLTVPALAAPMTPSVQQGTATFIDEKNITATTSGGNEIEVVIIDHPAGQINWQEEIVITPVTVLFSGGKSKVGGNLIDEATTIDIDSKQKVYNILDTAYNIMRDENRSLYSLTGNNSSFYNREDLRLCALFEVTYAWKWGYETEFRKDDTPYTVTLTFQGIKHHVVSVLHGTDDGTYWYPMRFTQAGDKVTVYDFKEFCPVAFVTTDDATKINEPIQPTGGGHGGNPDVPTSPQTGADPSSLIACSLATLAMGSGLVIRRRGSKR